MATKPEGGGLKASMTGPLRKELFCGFPKVPYQKYQVHGDDYQVGEMGRERERNWEGEERVWVFQYSFFPPFRKNGAAKMGGGKLIHTFFFYHGC